MTVIQTHHISRDPEETVRVFKGEHRILTLTQAYTRRKTSKGFIKALKVFIALKEDDAICLSEQE